ncbi:hypothetical protein EB061_01040 [bacterium]|nr:hypothetical protein [bacterium]
MLKSWKNDKTLTVQIHHENLNPRTFRIPASWIHRATWMAWALLGIAVVSSVYAVREYFSERAARPELVAELENEIENLKIALEKKSFPGQSAAVTGPGKDGSDPLASDQRPPLAPGTALTGKEGIWAGLADRINLPSATVTPTIRLEDARLDWQGKYANFAVNVLYHDPGKGSQQGHLVVLGTPGRRAQHRKRVGPV